MSHLKRTFRLARTYCCPHPSDIKQNIRLHNYGESPTNQDFWLPRFIQTRGIDCGKSISIFTVFGWRKMIALNRSKVKIFMARENLHRPNWIDYVDIALNERSIDLSLGFDNDIDDKRYLRFPLWITWLFPPEVEYKDIKTFCDMVNGPGNSSYEDRRFCAMINSHDDEGRQELFTEINSISHIDSCGRFLHNCDDLKKLYDDNKLKLLRNYRFNLCPENSNHADYCTEKIFEAIAAGCIPLYWGCNQQPEPTILNPDAICFIKLGEKNDNNTINSIRYLNDNKEAYLHFVHQPRLLPEAADIIIHYLNNLESHLREIIKNA